ncbi:MAG: adenylate/guanylate cyclase domain-containing protein [Balneolaceae bacterium]
MDQLDQKREIQQHVELGGIISLPYRIARLWQRYQQFGITDALPASEVRYVRALNGMVLIVTGLLWLQLPFVVGLLPETRYILASFFLWPLLWQVIPLLNHRGKYTAARLFFSFSTLILIALNAVQLGPTTENHLFMISVFLGGFIIYPPKDFRLLTLVVVLSASALVGLEWFYSRYAGLIAFPAEFVQITRWSSMSALFLIVLAITIYHYRVVTEAERKLELEHQRSEGLLLNILPASIAEQLKRRETPIADRIEDASVLFADIIGFTELAGRIPHERVVEILNTLFSEFDRISARHGLEKIKMIGDSYMVAGGVPIPIPGHHIEIAACAIEMLEYVRSGPVPEAPELGVRIGIHCGPVVAGVICDMKFAYDIWGDTVNIASRMESHGMPNRIQVSSDFHARTCSNFQYHERAAMQVKGKGVLKTYLIEGEMKQVATL